MNITRTTPRVATIAVVALLALAGCSAQPADQKAEPAKTSVPAADVVTIEDGWVKSADEGMSAAFGTVKNSGDVDANLVSVSSDASSMLELHETVEGDAGDMVMQEKEGGFVIPAGKDFVLEPGANHIMLMDLSAPLKPGDEVELILTFSDNSEYQVTLPVKDYSGANENYEGDGHGDGHGDDTHDHSDH